ncbi:hypothetical protein IEN85_07025 [Pelagicoccus sp. NFK12]|uniref:Uncharacterized protein n=1 Tax=Pelagicoccus enzymogenes TaxID=2773457 RepID=A0A927F8R5_9BACT|nr:hypothetical protein [Pelagicoccus enzymogenes]MBD5779240.1 hypothetical protein [Pelagicoccus enzymogenes]MDQ8198407.1 hypothetical protein [Pelagicoccus enzymogenes]
MKKLKSKEPKLSTLIFTACSGIALGIALGAFLLLSKNVSVASSVPDPALLSKPGNYNTYYLAGRVDGGESPNLRSGKGRIQRRSPGPVSFSEGEVNYFFKSLDFGEPVDGEGAPVKVSPFNVRIEGDQIYTSLKIVVDQSGSPVEFMVMANVGFDNTDEGPEFKVKSLRINSLPIPGMAGLVSSMIESKIAETPWPEEVLEMWQNIRAIEVESGKLITEVGLRRA